MPPDPGMKLARATHEPVCQMSVICLPCLKLFRK